MALKSNNQQLTIGKRVRLKENYKRLNGDIFTAGHEFTIYDSSYRGVDLIDDNGNKICEALFIHDQLEVIEDEITKKQPWLLYCKRAGGGSHICI